MVNLTPDAFNEKLTLVGSCAVGAGAVISGCAQTTLLIDPSRAMVITPPDAIYLASFLATNAYMIPVTPLHGSHCSLRSFYGNCQVS
ncbi:hypothetical protein SAMN02745225_02277 [Ferrithrix thermotolerans DSM 19514]|uniref:Uncharacterized protein n=1 Tax=Ferrithrix thermotolerans DSM 19514 TaxID=1121881 RepID=A0A1M4Y8Y7_9ACTN|nr:hypothetical protein SAMN02745225_02277 [Ferrithrix thermotolerans DSM 19514]